MNLREAIEKHIYKTGNGFEIDDVMSIGRFPREVTDRIYDISRRYSSPDYPIGISNPDSFTELRSIADEFPRL